MNINNILKPRSLLNLFVAAVGLGALILGALYLTTLFASRSIQTGSQTQQSTVQEQVSTIVTPAITEIDPETGWKIHKDAERGFILKYPSSWYIDYPGARDLFAVTTITNYDLGKSQPYRPFASSDIKILLSWSYENAPSTQPIGRWVQERAASGMMSIISLSEKRIGNNSAFHVVTRDDSPQGSGNLLRIYYVPHNNGRVFVISATPADSIHQPTLERIIANLQFTD